MDEGQLQACPVISVLRKLNLRSRLWGVARYSVWGLFCAIGWSSVRVGAHRSQQMDERQQTERAQQQLPTRHPPGPPKSGNENVVVDVESPRRTRRRAMPFRDARSAIIGTVQAWLPQLVESNKALEEALLLLRDLLFARRRLGEDVVLEMVEHALTKAQHTRDGYGARKARTGKLRGLKDLPQFPVGPNARSDETRLLVRGLAGRGQCVKRAGRQSLSR